MTRRKKNIAILTEVSSPQQDISLGSALHIYESLDRQKYEAHLVVVQGSAWKVQVGDHELEVNKNDFSLNTPEGKVDFEFAFIAHYDRSGRGPLQAYLDLMEIPYDSSGFMATSLTANKFLCKSYLKTQNIPFPKGRLIHKNQVHDLSEILEEVGLPCFVKPNQGGGKRGTTKVERKEDLEHAMNVAFQEDIRVLVEEFIEAKHIHCALAKFNNDFIVFPLAEVSSVPPLRVIPADLPEGVAMTCQHWSLKACELLGCEGWIRVEFLVKDEDIYFLEINSLPGMAPKHLYPEQMVACGLSMEGLCHRILEHHFPNE